VGSVRLATIYSLGIHYLPPYLKAFLRAHPHVSVQIEYQRASQVYEDVLGNAVDLGLVAYPAKESRLELIPLREEALVLACPPGHPLAQQKAVKLEQLRGERFVGFASDVPTRKALDRVLREAEVEVEMVMEFDNSETVKRAVEIEAGVAIVPQSTIAREVAEQTLVAVPFADPLPGRPLAVIYRRSKVLSPAVKRFVEILKETA
jgi:DNA-binding transcriptional LysR family regulator